MRAVVMVMLVSLSQAQLFGENMFGEAKDSPLLDKVTIAADLMEDMEVSESQLTEQQLKIRDFYR